MTPTLAVETADTVTLPRADYDQLVTWAACWTSWWSPAWVAYRADEIERYVADRIRSISQDISAARDWGNPAGVPIGHAELQRRRYPWVYDPAWRCDHGHRHGQCGECARPQGRGGWPSDESGRAA